MILICSSSFSNTVDSIKTGHSHTGPNTSFEASFKRIQSYRSFVLTASGVAKFSNDSIATIHYSKPFKYTVTYSDSAALTVDKNNRRFKNKGFSNTYESEPFLAMMMYCFDRRCSLEYKGTFDSLIVYQGRTSTRKYLLSVRHDSSLWRELSFLNAKEGIYEHVRFYYKKETSLPSAIAVEKMVGKDIVKDSLVLFNARMDKVR
jgi:hypothetical protein